MLMKSMKAIAINISQFGIFSWPADMNIWDLYGLKNNLTRSIGSEILSGRDLMRLRKNTLNSSLLKNDTDSY